MNEKMFYNFCIPSNEKTVMLRKITLLQLASMCCSITQNPLLVRCSANVGPTTILQLLNHGQMLERCQKTNNNVLPTTPTITQRWRNDCLLSGRENPSKRDMV